MPAVDEGLPARLGPPGALPSPPPWLGGARSRRPTIPVAGWRCRHGHAHLGPARPSSARRPAGAVAPGHAGRDPAANLHRSARRSPRSTDARRDHEQLQQGAGCEREFRSARPRSAGDRGRARTSSVSLASRARSSARWSSRPQARAESGARGSAPDVLGVRSPHRPDATSPASFPRPSRSSENLIQSATKSVVAVEPAGRVVTWNPRRSACSVGARRGAGQALGDAMPAAAMVQLSSRCWPPRGPAEPWSCASSRRRPRPAELAADLLAHLRGGAVAEIGLLLMIRDVTEQRRWRSR